VYNHIIAVYIHINNLSYLFHHMIILVFDLVSFSLILLEGWNTCCCILLLEPTNIPILIYCFQDHILAIYHLNEYLMSDTFIILITEIIVIIICILLFKLSVFLLTLIIIGHISTVSEFIVVVSIRVFTVGCSILQGMPQLGSTDTTWHRYWSSSN